jgi:hypothetical protein
MYECRCDERLKVKDEGSTHLTYTGLVGGLEHLKVKDRDEIVNLFDDCILVVYKRSSNVKKESYYCTEP